MSSGTAIGRRPASEPFGVVRPRLISPRAVLVDSGPHPEGGQLFGGWLVAQPYPEALGRDMHECFEIGVLMSGRQDRYFDDLVLDLGPGDVYLSPAWELHGWQTTAPGTRELVLLFRPEFLGEESFEGMSWLSLFAAAPRDRPRARTQEARQRVLGVSEQVTKEMRERRRGWLTAVRLGIVDLLFAIGREWDAADSGSSQGQAHPSNLARIAPAMTLVQSRQGRRVSLGEGAGACSLSISQFSHVFRQTMGLSFGRFALRARLTHAAEVVLSTDMPLAAIAERFEFVDTSHFYRAFTRHYGCTPARFREEGRRRETG